MKIGIQSSFFFNYSQLDGLTRMREIGYECADFQDFINTETDLFTSSLTTFESRLLEVSDACRAAGIEISQTHGPWRWPPQDAAEEDRQERFDKMALSLHGTKVLGCPYMVIHPIMPFGCDQNPDPERFYELNLDFYRRLTKVAEREQVTICLENMPMPALTLARPAEILSLVKEIDSPNLQVCLDTGHCTMCGVSPADAVRELGSYLKVMHVHDNNGWADLHLLPYAGVIDWEAFRASLIETGFDGTLSLETGVKRTMPEPLLSYHETGLFRVASHLAGRG